MIGDAPPEGIPVFRAEGDREELDAFRLDAAYLIADRVQIGAGVPLIRRLRETEANRSGSSTGLGDATLNSTYELLPEWSYSTWRPRGFGFFQLTIPSSPSIYESSDAFALDARGRGFWSVALGGILVKTWGDWDLIASVEGHRSFSRTSVAADGSVLELHPGWGGSALLGAGMSPGGGNFRFGLSIAPVVEGSIEIGGDLPTRSDPQLVWNTAITASYLWTPIWSSSVAYVDQTLLGPAKNVSLSRAVSLSLQRRWEL